MALDKVLSASIANAAVNASAISNTANLVIGALNTGNTVVTGTQFVNGAVTFANSTGNTLNISLAGIVGIGTNVANNTVLHIVGDWVPSNSTVKIQSRTANLAGIGFYNSTGTRLGIAYSDTSSSWFESAGALILNANNGGSGTNIYISANTNVGIGTATPDTKLTVAGNTNFSNNRINNFRLRDYGGHRIEPGPDTEYGGFTFQTTGGDSNAGYLLLRGTGDVDVYKQGGVTLVTDAGPITLAARGSTVGASSTNNFIRFMTNSGSGSAERVVISRDGYVTMSAQPRFYACGVTNTTYVSGNYWVFPTTVVNSGSYNTSNGRFTAPVAGTYLFFHSNIGGTTNEVFRYFLYKNGSIFNPSQFRIDTGASGGEYGTNGSKVTMMTLSKDDYVQVYWYSDGATNSYPGTNDTSNEYCIFGGYLLG